MPYNPNNNHRRSIRLKGYDYSQAGLYFVTLCCQDRICRFGEIKNDEMILNEYGNIAYNEWMALSERYPNAAFDVFQIMPNHVHGIVEIVGKFPVGATLAVALNENNITHDGNNAVALNENNITHDGNNAVALNENNITHDGNNAVAPNENNITHDGNNAVALNENNITHDGNNAVAPNENNITHDGNNIVHDGVGQPQGLPLRIGDIIGAYKSLVANGCLEIYKSNNQTMGKLWQRNYYEHIIRNEQSYKRIAEYIINNPMNWENDRLK